MDMKSISIIIFCFMTALQLNAQKYFTRTGVTQFEASEKAFEPIAATNKSTTVLLNTNTGAIAAQVFMAGFQFKNALMQEHFNENYMESHKYPKATFKGELQDFSNENLKRNSSFELSGTLSVKGVEKEIETTVTVKEENNRIYISGSFYVSPNDFGIKIPSIVREKIAQQIQISIAYELTEKK